MAAAGIRVIYTDLDGTMVGPGGCFFRAEDRSVTLEPTLALADLLASDIALVLVSGRTQAQLLEACGIFGADGYVAELGAVVGWDRGRERTSFAERCRQSSMRSRTRWWRSCSQQYAGRLEFHDPWHVGHELDVMLRGQVEAPEADAWFAAQGAPWLRMHDNGLLPPRATPRLSSRGAARLPPGARRHRQGTGGGVRHRAAWAAARPGDRHRRQRQ